MTILFGTILLMIFLQTVVAGEYATAGSAAISGIGPNVDYNSGTYGSSVGSSAVSGTYGAGYPHSQFGNSQYFQNSQIPNQQPFFNQPFPNFFPQFVPFAPITPFAPIPQISPISTPPEFNQALQKYWNNLQQQYTNGGSFAYSSPGANAYAYTSLGPSNLYKQHAALWNAWQQDGTQPNNVPYYAPNFASASGSYSPNGIHQTVGVYPENPNSPNVDTRFDASPSITNANSPGFYGVQTASFSSSSDVNGIKSNRRGAITSVNDNGKITTYKVDS